MCAIDWSLVADVLGALAGLTAAGVAGWALFMSYPDWLQRQNYRRKAEHAEQVLVAFYRCRASIRAVRSPIQFAAEIISAAQLLRDDGVEIENENTPLVTAQVQLTRIYSDHEVWDRLIELMPYIDVNFTVEAKQAIEDVLSVRQDFVAAARTFPSAENELLTGLRRKLFNNEADDLEDDFNRRLAAAEGVLRDELGPYIDASNIHPGK